MIKRSGPRMLPWGTPDSNRQKIRMTVIDGNKLKSSTKVGLKSHKLPEMLKLLIKF